MTWVGEWETCENPRGESHRSAACFRFQAQMKERELKLVILVRRAFPLPLSSRSRLALNVSRIHSPRYSRSSSWPRSSSAPSSMSLSSSFVLLTSTIASSAHLSSATSSQINHHHHPHHRSFLPLLPTIWNRTLDLLRTRNSHSDLGRSDRSSRSRAETRVRQGDHLGSWLAEGWKEVGSLER